MWFVRNQGDLEVNAFTVKVLSVVRNSVTGNKKTIFFKSTRDISKASTGINLVAAEKIKSPPHRRDRKIQAAFFKETGLMGRQSVLQAADYSIEHVELGYRLCKLLS